MLSKKQKLFLLLITCVVAVAAFLLVRQAFQGAPSPAGGEMYYNGTNHFSITLPESIASKGYKVGESGNRIIAFERPDGERIFEIHVFTADEWKNVKTNDEKILGEFNGSVFTLFMPAADALTPDEQSFIIQSFHEDK